MNAFLEGRTFLRSLVSLPHSQLFADDHGQTLEPHTLRGFNETSGYGACFTHPTYVVYYCTQCLEVGIFVMMLSTVARHMNEIRAECSSVKDQWYRMIVLLSLPLQLKGEFSYKSCALCVCVCVCACLGIPTLTTNQFKQVIHSWLCSSLCPLSGWEGHTSLHSYQVSSSAKAPSLLIHSTLLFLA